MKQRKRHTYTPEQDAYIRKHYNGGFMTASQIGKQLGLTRCSVIGRHWRIEQEEPKSRLPLELKSFQQYLDGIKR